MQAVILAGGEGALLKPLTLDRPKPLLPIVDRPHLSYILGMLEAANIHRVIITVDYLGEQIERYIKEKDSHIPITIYHVKEFKGTYSLLVDLHDQLEDEFLVINGDCMFDIELDQVLLRFKALESPLGIVARHEKDILGKGGLEVKDDLLQSIVSTPPSEDHDLMSDAQIYYMQKKIFSMMEGENISSIHLDLVQKALDKQIAVHIHEMMGFWAILGRITPYLESND
ncbi:MAG: NTP transferase domain-containing protein, partial [Candidatus Margulisbacteria bacterium]|nr:NTP transferase domain-containing protein [Candidatus Margulisiibacteriota bacterium]